MVSHEQKRKERIVKLLTTVKEHEGASEKAIIARFCLEEGAHPVTAKQYLDQLRITGKVNQDKECVYICVKESR